MSDPMIIPPSEVGAFKEKGWGHREYTIGDGEVKALIEGDVLALYDGEYTTAIRYDADNSNPEEPARVPVGELRELAEKWEEYGEAPDQACARELQKVIESYTDNE